MAEGDAVADILGTAETSRQPSSGVEEQISHLSKGGTTDAVQRYDGSVALDIMAAASEGTLDADGNFSNIAFMTKNSDYIRKAGTTDTASISGVQTNV